MTIQNIGDRMATKSRSTLRYRSSNPFLITIRWPARVTVPSWGLNCLLFTPRLLLSFRRPSGLPSSTSVSTRSSQVSTKVSFTLIFRLKKDRIYWHLPLEKKRVVTHAIALPSNSSRVLELASLHLRLYADEEIHDFQYLGWRHCRRHPSPNGWVYYVNYILSF